MSEPEVDRAVADAARRRGAQAAKMRAAAEKAVLTLVGQLELGDELLVEDGRLYRVERLTWLVSRWSGGQQPRMHPEGGLTLVLSAPGHAPVAMADIRQDFTDREAQTIEHVAGSAFFRWEGQTADARTVPPMKLADDEALVRFSRELPKLKLAATKLAQLEGSRMESATNRIREDE